MITQKVVKRISMAIVVLCLVPLWFLDINYIFTSPHAPGYILGVIMLLYAIFGICLVVVGIIIGLAMIVDVLINWFDDLPRE